MDHSAEFVVEENKGAGAKTGGDADANKAEAAHVQAEFQATKAQDEKQRLAQRQKQVDFGKNTIGYQRYLQHVPKDRRRHLRDPATPDIYQNVSKRCFDGQVKAWRRALHVWDQEGEPADRRGQKKTPPRGKPDNGMKEKSQATPGSAQSGSSSGESGGTDPCSSQGSLDGYMDPKTPHGRSRKRALEEEKVVPEQGTHHQHVQMDYHVSAEAAAEGHQECAHDAKRSNKAKDDDLPPKTPTCFPTAPGALLGQARFTETKSTAPLPGTTNAAAQESDVPNEDNVVHLILGNEDNSCSAMSWACDDQPCL